MRLKNKVLGLTAAALLPLGIVAMPDANASVQDTATCTDAGGTAWQGQVYWNDSPSSDGTIGITAVGFKSLKNPGVVDYTIKVYNGTTLVNPVIDVQDQTYIGNSWYNRNPVDPKSGNAKVTLSVGDGNDGKANCTMTFLQPKAATTGGGTISKPSTNPSVTTTQTPTAAPTTATPTPTPTTPPVPTTAAERYGWGTVTAGDEFNYAGVPDATKWSVYNGSGHSGNGLRKPENVTVNGTSLVIRGDSDGDGGGMSSRFDREGQANVVDAATDGGRWETRMRVYGTSPTTYRSPGWHPVLIVWPDAGRVDANGCQEMDYSESTSDPKLVKTYNHYACPNVQQASTSKAINPGQWYNYAVEWKSDKAGSRSGWFKTYVDGVLLYEVYSNDMVHDFPAHSTIQLDNFQGDLGTGEGTTKMEVDWTRYYAY